MLKSKVDDKNRGNMYMAEYLHMLLATQSHGNGLINYQEVSNSLHNDQATSMSLETQPNNH
jgi:hypothetical protein